MQHTHCVSINKKQLQRLRAHLPRGYQAKVQARMKQGVSLEYIRLVAIGKRRSDVVLNCLIDVAEEHMMEQKRIASRLNSLTAA